ncbi:tRNA (adenosine(37)-N6)-threonylcarbamoyltransferase complex ATPase subunit type 1 TsaE [Alteromonadaceae bacterium BrNp21-10]|nr:tRNA (adenosine(37)-N6)-threonylcarbamoyltransferase complex ATPase subunit type 1 TsaE [Alteromonadaceae bacterium BrNp21-10]
MTYQQHLINEQATLDFAAQLAGLCTSATIIYLQGDLGAGKTCFSRGFIQALGHVGRVKSPTYTLVEPYELERWRIFHFDLYRLSDPEELEYVGIRDYFADDCICLIEWPDKGHGMLVPADLTLYFTFVGQSRNVEIQAESAHGCQIISKLKQ